MKEQFINRYPITKTMRFSLIPVGKTEENFNAKLLLEEDKKRAEEYPKVKKYIDRYHRQFINTALSNLVLDNLKEYADLYYKTQKTEQDKKAMKDLEAKMRKQIATAMTKHPLYKDLFSEKIIKNNLLPLENDEERASVELFRGFFTYFSGFNQNRANMYSDEAKSTAISYRCINDNLPKFLDNAKNFAKIAEALTSDELKEIDEMALGFLGVYASDIFAVDYYSFVLSGNGIERYNQIIGGYSCSDGQKVQGLNECINHYNQEHEKNKRLPLFKMLYKQILSEKEPVSFIPEKFRSDDEVLGEINSFYISQNSAISDITELFCDLESFDDTGIFIKSGIPVTEISNAVFDDWAAVKTAWNREYEENHPPKKGVYSEKYYEEEAKAFKRIESFSIFEIERLGNSVCSEKGSIKKYYKNAISDSINNIRVAYENAKTLLTLPYKSSHNKKLCSDDIAIDLIKSLLDSIKELERLIKPLKATGKEEEKDDVFYGKFLPLFESIATVDKLYDKVRNYVTQKPYSKDKIKLNFENPQLLGGWDKNKERDYRTVLLRKNGFYYLAIMDKSNSKVFVNAPTNICDDSFEKLEYKLLPGPNKMLPKVFFAKSNLEYFNPDDEILEIRSKESFKKGNNFDIGDCHKLIDFYKESINKHPDWSKFNFRFSSTNNYKDISEFYREISEQGYLINFVNIPSSYIDECVEKGDIYLFKIYNKDFSAFSKGRPNLHTLYFKALFAEENLADVVFKLNGEAEMFFREASIKSGEQIIHPANKPIANKNPDNIKKQSQFEYDLIKDKRFTIRQFSIHIPITINYKSSGTEVINYDIRNSLKIHDNPYVIGIDRGERNLLFISVIDKDGKIVYQKSLNEIISNNGKHTVNYQKLLDKKEEERDKARKSWGTIENIKELKEGYISQVVHEICKLIVKYDAVIAMEDLNFGFKRGRFKVEKQVYQKFENMLISKLNYLCDKKITDPKAEGGIYKAYQLTNKYDGVNKAKQNGIIFFVPAWLTSKIDPTTGFSDLLHPKYTSKDNSIEFFGKFDDIRYNENTDMFEFDINYDNFPKCNADSKKQWTVCTNSERIITERNPEKNSEWDSHPVILTEGFKALFDEYKIDYSHDLKQSILNNSTADFHKKLTKLFALTLQMRNSVTGSTAPEDDYLISPVRNSSGEFYDSRNYTGETAKLPTDADANGAYNIARKGLWIVEQIKTADSDELDKINLSISNADWLEYAQNNVLL